ncbi:MAG: hypothetical protein IKU89_04480, partial [Oscillospiraceae bacterium]|nr:hypothetical protein [Oscillospiraceae bacterium]
MKKIIFKVLWVLALLSVVFSLTACFDGAKADETEYTTRSQTVSYMHFNTVTVLSSYGSATEAEFLAYVDVVDDTLG